MLPLALSRKLLPTSISALGPSATWSNLVLVRSSSTMILILGANALDVPRLRLSGISCALVGSAGFGAAHMLPVLLKLPAPTAHKYKLSCKLSLRVPHRHANAKQRKVLSIMMRSSVRTSRMRGSGRTLLIDPLKLLPWVTKFQPLEFQPSLDLS